MKKLLALFLVLLLSLTFVGCGEVGDGKPSGSDPEKPAEAGIFGEWYNTAGRKLEINEDGTYRIAHEAEGGTWKQQTEALLECTDAYGSFSAAFTATDAGARVTFGPYGEFFRATEEELARFAKAQLYPMGNVFAFEQGLAFASESLKASVINKDGLSVTFTGESLPMTPEFFGDFVILKDSVMEISTGKVIAKFRSYQKTDEHVIVVKNNTKEPGVVYAVIDSNGSFVVDWTPIPRFGDDSGQYTYSDAIYVHGDGNYLLYDMALVLQENREYLSVYYFVNPLTGKKFRIESFTGFRTLSTGITFSSGANPKACYAADWTSPATPVEYESFTVKADGTLVEAKPIPSCDMVQGDWGITFGNEQNGGKTVFYNAVTGEGFSVDLPSEQMQISSTEHYWAISYMNEEKTARMFILLDYQGNALCEPIEQNYYTVGGTMMRYMELKTHADGTFLLGKEPNTAKYYVYNAKGECLLTPEDLPVVGYCGDGLYFSAGKCVDVHGRVIIPGITYLPFK